MAVNLLCTTCIPVPETDIHLIVNASRQSQLILPYNQRQNLLVAPDRSWWFADTLDKVWDGGTLIHWIDVPTSNKLCRENSQAALTCSRKLWLCMVRCVPKSRTLTVSIPNPSNRLLIHDLWMDTLRMLLDRRQVFSRRFYDRRCKTHTEQE